MATPAQQLAFVQNNIGYAQQVSQQTGLPVDFVLGQSAIESSWGTSNLATGANNYFGVKHGLYGWAQYDSPADSFAGYSSLMMNSRYSAAVHAGGDAYTIANNLSAAGYTHDVGYASSIASTSSRVHRIIAAHPNLANAVANTAAFTNGTTFTANSITSTGNVPNGDSVTPSGGNGGSATGGGGGGSSGGGGGSSGGGGGGGGGSSGTTTPSTVTTENPYTTSSPATADAYPTARLGDYCTHGAVIITGSSDRTVNQRPAVRIGDMVNCPIHGINPIIAVANQVFTDNKGTIRMGAVAYCGAVVFVGSPDVLTM